MEEERKQIIKKSNSMIQKSKGKLSLQEQKIILYTISKIKKTDDVFEEYEFDLKNFCRVCGIEEHGQNYQNLKESIENLSNKSFWIQQGNEKILCHWVNKAWINEQETTIRIRLDDTLKPYLLQLKSNFTIYELENVLCMKSKYSVRLYEILKSYLNLKEYEIDIKELKELLGIEKKQYSVYKDFRVRVIDKAIEEINRYTDININYKAIRKNRKIERLYFSIDKKNNGDNKVAEIIRKYKLKKRKYKEVKEYE